MQLTTPPAALVPPGLRALKTVALANGELAAQERALLDAVQAMFDVHVDVDTLAPIAPDELAHAIVDPQLRRQLVHGMLLLALADGEAGREEDALVTAYAGALEIDAHEVRTFHRLAEGHLLLARLDVLRRFWVRPLIAAKAKAHGIGWVARALAAFTGLCEDTALADRYRALLDYPEGSLGRAYADFVRGNGLTFPGEKGSAPEPIVIHDLSHVLGGYGSAPADEICVTGFQAGYRRQDPFTFLLFSMMQFNLAIPITPIAPSASASFDAPRVIDAIRRGAAMNADLSDGGWDYWPDLALPLEEVRAKYGVPAAAYA